jgi:hypothetical protein
MIVALLAFLRDVLVLTALLAVALLDQLGRKLGRAPMLVCSCRRFQAGEPL